MKAYWITGTLFALVFAILLSIRLDLFSNNLLDQKGNAVSSAEDLPENETWMNVIQNGQKIGYSHTLFTKEEYGYRLQEYLYMHINTMGMAQDLRMKTVALLNHDLTFSSFDFKINSSRFTFSAEGKINGNILSIEINSAGHTNTVDIPLTEKPFLPAGIIPAINSAGLGPGDKTVFNVFNPATMSSEPVTVSIIGQEEILNLGSMTPVTKVSLEFKGSEQFAWIDINGRIIKESGLLGLILENTTPHDAISGFSADFLQDLTEIASVPSNVLFDNPQKLSTIEVQVEGIDLDAIHLGGGRQTLNENILTVKKESIQDLDDVPNINKIKADENSFLAPTPFIQSDHKRFKTLVSQIVGPDDPPVTKAHKLLDWVQKNITKQPVLSVPDALATLENRTGDCNEHAVLLAALARASGIPAKVEAGLVYLNGRYYYHAWNLLYLGRWITADALFNQIPADVTHIRFTSGEQESQLDLMGVIDKIKITVTGYH